MTKKNSRLGALSKNPCCVEFVLSGKNATLAAAREVSFAAIKFDEKLKRTNGSIKGPIRIVFERGPTRKKRAVVRICGGFIVNGDDLINLPANDPDHPGKIIEKMQKFLDRRVKVRKRERALGTKVKLFQSMRIRCGT